MSGLTAARVARRSGGIGLYGAWVDAAQTLLYYRQTLAGMTPTTYFCDLDYLFALSKGKPKMPYTTREYERRGQVCHYPPVDSESPSDSDMPYGDLNAISPASRRILPVTISQAGQPPAI